MLTLCPLSLFPFFLRGERSEPRRILTNLADGGDEPLACRSSADGRRGVRGASFNNNDRG